MRIVHPDGEYREAARRSCLKLGGFVESLNTNVQLYDSLKKLELFQSQFDSLDEEDKQVHKLLLHDFEQSGVHLNHAGRDHALSLLEEELALGVAFTEGCHSAPLNISDAIRDYGVQAVVWAKDHHYDSSIRENAYRVYYDAIPEQVDLMDRLISVRRELATLCGFQSFSHRSLYISMIGSPERAVAFLILAAQQLKPLAEKEMALFAQYKINHDSSSGSAGDLDPWDIGYYMHCLGLEMRDLDKQYRFSLGHCMNGLNVIFSSVFGLSLQVSNEELWSSDVVKLTVYNDALSDVGTIYCDFFARPGKQAQDSHFTIRCGHRLSDGSYQNPVVALVCNFPRKMPTLLSFDQMENLFHEMGHALHSILGRTKYQHVSGTRCATDLAEVPSHLMEKFAHDPVVLNIITQDDGHIFKSRKFGKGKPIGIGLQTLGQVILALTDLEVHGYHNAMNLKSASEVHLDMMSRYWPAPFLPNENRLQRFSHLSAYGAKYYSYLLARAVRNILWKKHFEGQQFNREAGEKLKQQFLSHGGSKPPTDILNDILGREPSVEELCESLLSECK